MQTTRHGASLLHVVIAFCLLSSSGCAWLDAKQRQIIYRPSPSLPTTVATLHAGDQRYFVPVPPETAHTDSPARNAGNATQQVEMWWLPQADKHAPTLLYFHGTFRNLSDNLHKMEALREAGFSVLAVDYRGWGLSTPITPSEQTILQDAEVAWSELQRIEPRSGSRVIYGHSMGSGVAVEVASRRQAPADYGALILESAFTSFPDLAHESGFLAELALHFNNERFASIDKIQRIQAPLLMIHGSADTTIPLKLGEKLFAAAHSPKRWVIIDGGQHSDLAQTDHMRYQTVLQRFRNEFIKSAVPGKEADSSPGLLSGD